MAGQTWGRHRNRPAIGAPGALSKALHTSQCSRTSSAKFTKCGSPPSESTDTHFSSFADARPPLTCNFAIIFLVPRRYHPAHLPRPLPYRPTTLKAQHNEGARPPRRGNASLHLIYQVASPRAIIRNSMLLIFGPRSARGCPLPNSTALRT